MLPKERKISRQDFTKMGRMVAQHHSPHFTLKKYTAHKKKEEKKQVFTVVVSGKVGKKAVERNKLKRRVFYIIKKHVKEGVSGQWVFIAKNGATKLSFAETQQEVRALLEKVNLS